LAQLSGGCAKIGGQGAVRDHVLHHERGVEALDAGQHGERVVLQLLIRGQVGDGQYQSEPKS
jgi:hypothetical protein